MINIFPKNVYLFNRSTPLIWLHCVVFSHVLEKKSVLWSKCYIACRPKSVFTGLSIPNYPERNGSIQIHVEYCCHWSSQKKGLFQRNKKYFHILYEVTIAMDPNNRNHKSACFSSCFLVWMSLFYHPNWNTKHYQCKFYWKCLLKWPYFWLKEWNLYNGKVKTALKEILIFPWRRGKHLKGNTSAIFVQQISLRIGYI